MYVALFARAWIEIASRWFIFFMYFVALFARAWIEIKYEDLKNLATSVALFARAWIEIRMRKSHSSVSSVALFARAWIEMPFIISPFALMPCRPLCEGVDWNGYLVTCKMQNGSRPLCEGVDWNPPFSISFHCLYVALFARAWIEMYGVQRGRRFLHVALFARAWIEMVYNLKS